jgi:plasmid stability protein
MRLWILATVQPHLVVFCNRIEYYWCMSALTVKNLDEAILRRLAEKAASAGESTQEYIRQLLARDAQLHSADEMLELQRQRRVTASDPDDLDAAVARRASRRQVA